MASPDLHAPPELHVCEQARLSREELAPQAHDLPLMAVVTEVQVWSPD